MFLYQFMIAVRTEDGKAFTNESGEETMHLNGLFYRTIKFLELGIKPLYVFDGKAPDLKSDEVIIKLEKILSVSKNLILHIISEKILKILFSTVD